MSTSQQEQQRDTSVEDPAGHLRSGKPRSTDQSYEIERSTKTLRKLKSKVDKQIASIYTSLESRDRESVRQELVNLQNTYSQLQVCNENLISLLPAEKRFEQLSCLHNIEENVFQVKTKACSWIKDNESDVSSQHSSSSHHSTSTIRTREEHPDVHLNGAVENQVNNQRQVTNELTSTSNNHPESKAKDPAKKTSSIEYASQMLKSSKSRLERQITLLFSAIESNCSDLIKNESNNLEKAYSQLQDNSKAILSLLPEDKQIEQQLDLDMIEENVFHAKTKVCSWFGTKSRGSKRSIISSKSSNSKPSSAASVKSKVKILEEEREMLDKLEAIKKEELIQIQRLEQLKLEARKQENQIRLAEAR